VTFHAVRKAEKVGARTASPDAWAAPSIWCAGGGPQGDFARSADRSPSEHGHLREARNATHEEAVRQLPEERVEQLALGGPVARVLFVIRPWSPTSNMPRA
jgi:hypothetical protein